MTLEELKVFCADSDEIRYCLQTPWTRDGFTWASDACILVRVPAMAEIPENPKGLNAMKTWNSTPEVTQWFPVPKTSMPAPIACRWCDGEGKDPGDRRRKCENCRGTGKTPDHKSASKINGVHYAKRYLALIQGWEIAPTGPVTAAWIRNSEATGLLMPIRV